MFPDKNKHKKISIPYTQPSSIILRPKEFNDLCGYILFTRIHLYH